MHSASDAKTASMLQRVPVILAVTAASYGLEVPPQAQRWAPAGTPSRSASVPKRDAQAGAVPARQQGMKAGRGSERPSAA